MKKQKLLLVLAIPCLALVGCSRDTSSSEASSSETISSLVASSLSSEVNSSIEEVNSSEGSSSSSVVNLSTFALALKQDYSNMTATITQSYNEGEDVEQTTEYYYDGYTIIYDENAAAYGDTNPYLYYHQYNGASYLYFEPDQNASSPCEAWLNKGYMDADLSLEHTYFNMATLLSNLTSDDVSYSAGAFYINSSEKVTSLNQNAFSFAWFNDLTDISFTITDGYITSIMGFDDLNNENNFVKITLTNVGTTTYDEEKLPSAPNENNVMEYWKYKGYDGPYQEKYITSITASINDKNAKVEEGYDAVLDIEKSVKIASSYLPEDANKTTIKWASSNEDVVKVTYDNQGNKLIYAVGAGEAKVYAYNDENSAGVIKSNELTIKVNELKKQDKTNAVYDLTYSGIIDNTIAASNSLENQLPLQVTGDKVSVIDGGYSSVWTKEDTAVILNPSENGVGDAYIMYDFGDQQVNSISFYYALYYNAGKSNLDFLKTASILTSNDGENWETIDILDEVKENISVDNLKLMEKTFAPASKIKISLDTGFTGKNIHFAFTETCFGADKTCHGHEEAPETVSVSEIKISSTKTSLYVGKSVKLTSLVSPSDATDPSLNWVSSSPEVASVSSDGIVTALSASDTPVVIYAINQASGVKSNEVEITINAALNVDASLVGKWTGETDSSSDEITIVVNDDNTLSVVDGDNTYTMKLEDFEDKYYVFMTEDETSCIKIKIASGYSNKAEVNGNLGDKTIGKYVGAKEYAKEVLASSISLSSSKTTLIVGDEITLTKKVLPADTTETSFTYSSSNEDIATVSSSGKVTALAPGKVTITLTSQSGVKGTIELDVIAKTYPTSITVTGETSANVGDKINLTATLSPSDVTEKDVVWSSSDTSIATVNASGVVEIKKDGSVTITCKSKDGEASGSITITIAKSEAGFPQSLVGDWTCEDMYSSQVSITIIANGNMTLVDEYDNEVECTLSSIDGATYTYTTSDDMEITLTVSGDEVTISDYYGTIMIMETTLSK